MASAAFGELIFFSSDLLLGGDKFSATHIMKIVAHTSESEWNLSIEHPRHLTKFPKGGPSMSWTEMQHCDGAYTELRHVYIKPIDATLFRVNKTFHQTASCMLYGDNLLSFKMRKKDWKHSPGTCYFNGKHYYLH
ncbi:hypothetical protein DL95DRAFT_417154 [Leptodontidium sp. 2 PMI_412]|nr:hypothetical protein DL95DRAFT_417154 [Leptodontidium sp. 2 PMI_412]